MSVSPGASARSASVRKRSSVDRLPSAVFRSTSPGVSSVTDPGDLSSVVPLMRDEGGSRSIPLDVGVAPMKYGIKHRQNKQGQER
jgi:hypothetical protein